MTGISHGSACLQSAPEHARRVLSPSPQRGSSRRRPRRGSAYVARRTRGPRCALLLAHHSREADQLALLQRAAASVLEEVLALAPGGDAYAAVPLWSGAQRWARVTVPVAYATHRDRLRAQMPHDAVSLKTLVAVADARARFAEGRTGRHCRPTNATLAALTGLDARTIRRATRWLAAIGCATEILRGRQRTKQERLATWRLGSRQRGWASVWALHPPRPVVDNSRTSEGLWRPVSSWLSTHPRRGSVSVDNLTFSSLLPTDRLVQNPAKAGHSPPIDGGASRHHPPTRAPHTRWGPTVDERGRLLGVKWLANGQTPAWAARHTPRGWAGLLASPAAHGWTPDDINQAIREWTTVGANYLPENPHRPIGLLGAILRWHGLEPPGAADRARAAEAAATRAAINACSHCDENGWLETEHGMQRCIQHRNFGQSRPL